MLHPVTYSAIKNPYKVLNINILSLFSYPIDEDGIGSNEYTIKLEIESHIPDTLPVRGKRVKLSYPGIPAFCTHCWRIGHAPWDCERPRANWLEYVSDFHDNPDVTEDMLGSWVDALKKYYPPCGGARKQKTDLRPKKNEDLREHLDQKKQKPSQPSRGRGRGNGRGGRGGRGGHRQSSPEQRPKTDQNQKRQESPDRRQYGRRTEEPAKKTQDPEQRGYGRKQKK